MVQTDTIVKKDIGMLQQDKIGQNHYWDGTKDKIGQKQRRDGRTKLKKKNNLGTVKKDEIGQKHALMVHDTRIQNNRFLGTEQSKNDKTIL